MNKLRLAYLYPDYLNLYGDRGNIICLRKRAIWHNFDFEVTRISIGDKFEPYKYDLIFMGGGQDSDQQLIYDDLINDKGERLKEAIEAGIVMLSICGGYQLMGHRYVDHSGREIKGLGILDIETIAKPGRLVGDLIFETQLPIENKVLIGFENHGGRTYLGKKAKPIGKVLVGSGNNGEDQSEGVYYKNLYGTYSHGSFLPRNPDMADYLLKLAVERKGFEWQEDNNSKFNQFVLPARKRILTKYSKLSELEL
ncbi:MAG: glutamine amidotransferase [Clostridiaceae bacterium]|nr:glutamine amidotransferase [Clostridiaceae bacterium]